MKQKRRAAQQARRAQAGNLLVALKWTRNDRDNCRRCLSFRFPKLSRADSIVRVPRCRSKSTFPICSVCPSPVLRVHSATRLASLGSMRLSTHSGVGSTEYITVSVVYIEPLFFSNGQVCCFLFAVYCRQ